MNKIMKIHVVDSMEMVIYKNGKATRKIVNYDLMTNAGFAGLAAITGNVGGVAFTYIEIGTGTVDASTLDTTLGTAVKRKTTTGTRHTTDCTNDTTELIATFAAADGLSGTTNVSEAGILNASSSGTLLCRQVFAPETLIWANGDSVVVTYRVQYKAGA
jgi:hypothetical protein